MRVPVHVSVPGGARARRCERTCDGAGARCTCVDPVPPVTVNVCVCARAAKSASSLRHSAPSASSKMDLTLGRNCESNRVCTRLTPAVGARGRPNVKEERVRPRHLSQPCERAGAGACCSTPLTDTPGGHGPIIETSRRLAFMFSVPVAAAISSAATAPALAVYPTAHTTSPATRTPNAAERNCLVPSRLIAPTNRPACLPAHPLTSRDEDQVPNVTHGAGGSVTRTPQRE